MGTDHTNVFALRLEETRDPCDGACGAHGTHKMRDAARRLLPDFRSGGLEMNTRVVSIGKLVQYAALALGLHLGGQITGIFHATAFGREDEFSTKRLHGLCALDAQVLRHDEHHAVAFDSRRHGQRDACVA